MTGSAPLLKTVSPRWPQIAPAGMAQESETSGYDIVIHPASSRSHRRWHDSRWAELIAYFRNCGFSPILVGASSERNLLEGIARTTTSSCAVSTPDFCELQHFISKAKLVVCVDSFIMHAAWALNRPVLALYGPSCPKNTAPLTSKARVMWNDTILSPPYTAWTGPRPVSSISVRGVIRGIEELYIGE